MTKSPQNDSVGDSKSPALRPQEDALRDGVDQAQFLVAEASRAVRTPSASAGLAVASQADSAPAPTSCQQQPWLSFFFDGTGNNLNADIGTFKHSNIARLYRVHADVDPVAGIYRVYVPGVGTYFREVGDNGGGKLGLGMGRYGQVRLDWALEQFDKLLQSHLARANSPGNKIVEINVALFGFSRGAAMARAFSNILIKERCVIQSGGCRLKQGNHRLRIRFMGLFDTVASVGLPMSTNNLDIVASGIGIRQLIATRAYAPVLAKLRPDALAFAPGAAPGADPAPGVYDGHSDWGNLMAIPHVVEHVRHFVAAHEVRNSFPVDSISVLRDGQVIKPEHFHETVFPGAHSDVGGGYREGEGGRSKERQALFSLVTLSSMYQLALEHGVPLLPRTAWSALQAQDFETSATLLQHYNYYHSKFAGMSNLGPLINAHMGFYFAWRFRAIRRKMGGDRNEANDVRRADAVFKNETASLDREVSRLEDINNQARRDVAIAEQRWLSYVQSNYSNPTPKDLPKYEAERESAKNRQRVAEDNYLRAKAKRDAQPDMSEFSGMVDMYDAQLMADVKAVRDVFTKRGTFGGDPDSARRGELRPHYKVMLEAYENEFIHNKGLQDETIIAFFDNYVHDSLAGFATDATLPSDPRVVYLGGDEKYRYAMQQRSHGNEVQYANRNVNDGQRSEVQA
ncbi:DUF2235 domain-containing protein [Massilia sp.]|uniref:T6SS phospholipase effector Tle1-like catalytic domain-containing protein n=1 Tax=Massilia sp. TaxID=1882437 RepID=UPI00289DE215|nr:DUF2235 domain-containing protein [Massilia sp.]